MQEEKNYYDNVGVDTSTSNYCKTLDNATEEEHEDVACIRAVICQRFEYSKDLNSMKHKQSKKTTDKHKWKKVSKEYHVNFARCDVLKDVPKDKVPDDVTIIGSSWDMKKKSKGMHRDRLNYRGNDQIDGVHYYSKNSSSLVVSKVTFRVVLTIF